MPANYLKFVAIAYGHFDGQSDRLDLHHRLHDHFQLQAAGGGRELLVS